MSTSEPSINGFRPPRVYYDPETAQYRLTIPDEDMIIKTRLKNISKIQSLVNKYIPKDKRYKYPKGKNNQKFPRGVSIQDIDELHRQLIQRGYGSPNEGLTNIQIDLIMKRLGMTERGGFRGAIPVDFIDKIKPTMKPFCFIVNTDPSKYNGKILEGRHWIAINILPSLKDSASIEYFDPFGDPPEADVRFDEILLPDMEKLIASLNLKYMLKWKVNNIPHQPIEDSNGSLTTTCGYYCIRFLFERNILGKTWNEAISSNIIPNITNEKEIEIGNFKREIDNLIFI